MCLLSIDRADRVYIAMFPLDFPQDTADQFVRFHLREIDCDVATLAQIVDLNHPTSPRIAY
jgi:hypothetical protein